MRSPTPRTDPVSAFGPTVFEIGRRSLIRIVRMPAILVPTIVMPVFFVIGFTGSFEGVTRIEGFPTEDFINWVGPYALVQTAAFAGIGAAGTMATDLDNGFIDRLLVAPIRRSAIIFGPLAYTAMRALIPITLVLLLSIPQGGSLPGGLLGLFIAVVGGMGGALMLGSMGLAVVLRIGHIRAMAIVQIVAFAFLFPSIGQVPLPLLSGWLHTVARFNPATNLIRMTRQGFIGDVSWAETWPGLLVIAIGLGVFTGWARYELDQRAP